MSKKKTKTKQFVYTPTQTLPKLKTIKTTWDLKKLFYTSEKDPQIERDLVAAEKAFAKFAKKYQDGAFAKSPKSLLAALKEYKKLHNLLSDKPAWYFSLRLEKNTQDTKAQQAMNLLEQRLGKLHNQLVFFPLVIGNIPKTKQATILKNKDFAEFKFMLEGIFETAKYTLTEAEEKIINLKSLPARSMWIAGTDKLLGAATVQVGDETMPLNGALMKMLDAPRKERHQLWKACIPALEQLGPVAENELNAVITDKKINDELRGYQKPYSATALSYDSNEKSIEALAEAVTTKGYAISKKYFKLKKKLIGKNLDFIDRNEPLGKLPSVDFETAATICRDAFYKFNPLYGHIFDEMLQSGQMDVYSTPGKGGGAFCASGTNMPTVVLLNHSDDFGSMRTLAHEMGHAVHAYRSKQQSVLYDGHSTITAETASTFFEAVVGRALLETLPEKQKIILLDSLISDKIDTMIMCIARYSAELEIHEAIRERGSLTWQEMSKILANHFRQYCGSAINVRDTDGLSVIAKTHYRRNFYQFTYSFGNIASSIMYQRYQKNAGYAEQIEQFLAAGDSADVATIFKDIGINVTTKKVFMEGLDMLEAEIDLLQQLTKKKK